MDSLQNSSVAVGMPVVRGHDAPPGALSSPISGALDFSRMLVSFLKRTVHLIDEVDRPSDAIGVKMETMYDTLRKYCISMNVPDIYMLIAFAGKRVFYVWWKKFQLDEGMAQFKRSNRGIVSGVSGYRYDHKVMLHAIVCAWVPSSI